MAEKEYPHEPARELADEGVANGEIARVAIEDKYGHLRSRHIQFIALGGAIGTSLFLGIGSSLAKAGPLSLLLGFSITGLAVYGMMVTLGEMTTWLPVPGAIPQFCSRFVDDSLGFAVGWNNWYFCAIVVCLDISAASVVIDYWPGARSVSPAVWITIIILVILFLNVFAVSIYGEAEFWFASIKLITILGLLILSVVIILDGGPSGDRLGFRYWNDPGAMKELSPASGATGRFLAFFSTLIYAAFTYAGVEMVAAAGGEAEDPRRNVPKAVRRVVYRILLFYVLGTLAIGCMVASNDPNLFGGTGAARSPWVIGITKAGISVLPDIINAVILASATSSVNAFLYTGSRYLYALASDGQAPKVLLKCTKTGVPIYCVLVTSSISLLTYMTVSVAGTTVFLWFANLVTVASMLTWISICAAFIRFREAQKVQGLTDQNPWFRGPLQPYTAWATMIFFSVLTVFNGFEVFLEGHWNISDFLVAYIGIPIFGFLVLFWKFVKRTKIHSLATMDLMGGRAEIDALEGTWDKPVPKNFAQKVWFWLV
ncbi:putative proline-specific permease put4 [Cyphellophora attinorum]|uniref:Putative proline-specific permease put4 n=1 Tax=Cyphellophora attinorum TaxID=1664694 RepID=A0A0N1P0L0_9EURO|nr:putative proline-specific permease put4 [Phialophora attinorum]KPI40602.1 putative proline-specific permease put4 [Phialophora attinorum]